MKNKRNNLVDTLINETFERSRISIEKGIQSAKDSMNQAISLEQLQAAHLTMEETEKANILLQKQIDILAYYISLVERKDKQSRKVTLIQTIVSIVGTIIALINVMFLFL